MTAVLKLMPCLALLALSFFSSQLNFMLQLLLLQINYYMPAAMSNSILHKINECRTHQKKQGIILNLRVAPFLWCYPRATLILLCNILSIYLARAGGVCLWLGKAARLPPIRILMKLHRYYNFTVLNNTECCIVEAGRPASQGGAQNNSPSGHWIWQ